MFYNIKMSTQVNDKGKKMTRNDFKDIIKPNKI